MNEIISNALTRETPGKVFGLLGAAMFSLAFMLAVTMSDASFSKTYSYLSDPFAMENVASTMDSTASGYSKFLTAYLFQPLKETYSVYSDNIAYVANESGLSYVLGFGETETQVAQAQSTGKVAGAYTHIQPAEEKSSGVLDILFSLIK